MPTSLVTVYNSSKGKFESNARVVLEWSGFTNLGQSSPVSTDSKGQAVINHSSSGKATVYVNGRSYGAFSTPGSYTVKI